MSFIYLASPYTASLHCTPTEAAIVRQMRYDEAAKATAWFLCRGKAIFSPIVHCHGLAIRHDLPKDIAFWKWYNDCMLGEAYALYVLTLKDWESSKGVQHEIEIARSKDLAVWRVEEEDGTYISRLA